MRTYAVASTSRSEPGLRPRWRQAFTKRLLATALSLAFASSVFAAAAPATASDATGYFGGHRYDVFEVYAEWSEAAAYCDTDAHLVTIGSAKENAFVFGLSPGAWLGATDEDVEGRWRWVTGEPFAYTNWEPGEPNDANAGEDYVIFGEGGRWNDVPGEEIYKHVVCESGTSRADCKDGGWEALGFENLGLCVRFSNTGKDSR